MSEYESEEQRLKKSYDQARTQGDKKKKKEYKEKIVELNRRKKQEIRAGKRDSIPEENKE
ncbi:MAG: hypothetical protein M1368_04675 [Thaumarchaeota archaeon]|nr:hypothetical protein [Nitrososphaerota archaeon]